MSETTENTALMNIVPGDEVILKRERWGGQPPEIVRVSKVTSMHIVVDPLPHSKFRRHGGGEAGTRYTGACIEALTEEGIEAVARTRRIVKIRAKAQQTHKVLMGLVDQLYTSSMGPRPKVCSSERLTEIENSLGRVLQAVQEAATTLDEPA